MITHAAMQNTESNIIIYAFYADGTEDKIVLDDCAEGWLRQDIRDLGGYQLSEDEYAARMQAIFMSALYRMGVEI